MWQLSTTRTNYNFKVRLCTQILQIIQFSENIYISKLPFLNSFIPTIETVYIPTPQWASNLLATTSIRNKANRPRLTRCLGVNRWATRRKICRHISHLDREEAKRDRAPKRPSPVIPYRPWRPFSQLGGTLSFKLIGD